MNWLERLLVVCSCDKSCCRRLAAVPYARGMVLFLLLACVHPAGAATDEECAGGLQLLHPSAMADRIRQDWGALHESYVRYSGCDSSILAGVHSRAASELLAGQWQQIRRLEELGDSDPAFVDWVVNEGISAEISQDKLGAIYENASDHCPAGLDKLCERITIRQSAGMGFRFARVSDSVYELMLADGAMEVKARIREVGKSGCSYTDRWLAMKGGGGGYECPSTVMDKLEASCGGRPSHVPPMSYNDIVDVHEVQVWGDGSSGCSIARIDVETAAGCSYVYLRDNIVQHRNDTRSCHASVDDVTYDYIYDAATGQYALKFSTVDWHRGKNIEATVLEAGGLFWIDRINTRHVHIPVSAYSGLRNVRDMSVKELHESMDVILIRGDIHTTLLFIESWFLYRKILLPDPHARSVREETEYSYN